MVDRRVPSRAGDHPGITRPWSRPGTTCRTRRIRRTQARRSSAAAAATAATRRKYSGWTRRIL